MSTVDMEFSSFRCIEGELIQLQTLEAFQKALIFPPEKLSGFAGVPLEMVQNDSIHFPFHLR